MTLRIPQAVQDRIVGMLGKGHSYRQIRDEVGVSLDTITRVNRELVGGPKPRSYVAIQGERLDDLIQRYKAQETIKSLSERFDVTPRCIMKTLRRAGVPPNHPHMVTQGPNADKV